MIDIAFNQKLKVPSFISQEDKPQGRRALIALSEIDVTRDVMDFQFVLRSDIDPENFTYSLGIEEWTQEGMKVLCNFSDPLMISKGLESDVLQIKIKNRFLFKSLETGQTIRAEDVEMPLRYQFPKQLPDGVSEEDIEQQAMVAGNAMLGLIIIQLIAQLFLKKGMNDLFSLYYSLQIACYLQIYNIDIPANAVIFVTEFTKLIEFQFLNPQGFVRLFQPEFVLKDWIAGQKSTYSVVVNKDQKASVFDDMLVFMFMGAIGIIIVILL